MLLRQGKAKAVLCQKVRIKSNEAEIKDDTFNCGDTKYATEFIKSKGNIAKYRQQTTTNGWPRIGKIVREMRQMRVVMPLDLGPDDKVAFEKWRIDICKAEIHQELIKKNVQRTFAVVYNQCLLGLKTELKGMTGINTIMSTQDVVKLLMAIRSICTKDREEGMMS